MSDAGEPTKPGNEESSTGDECSDLGNQTSPTAPVTPSSPKNNPTEVDSSDPKTDIPAKPETNGLTTSSNSTSAATENQNRDAGLSTPPRCDSPRLRQLLSSPLQPKIQSSLVAPELQGVEGLKSEATTQEGADLQGKETRSDSEAKIIPGAKSVKTTKVESVPKAMQVSESSKRDALDEAEAASKAVKSTEAESVPEAGISSNAEVSNVPEARQGTAAEGDNVPRSMQGTEEVYVSEAMQVAEVQEVNVLKAKKDIVTEDKMSEVPEISVAEAEKESVAEVTENNEVVSDVKDSTPAKSKVASESTTEAMQVEKEKEDHVPEPIQKQAAEGEMSEVSESSVVPQKTAAKHSDPAKSELASEAATEDMQTSEPAESDPSFKKPSVSSKIQSMKGRLGDIKLEEPSVPESPKRRSARLQTLQRTHSESPSPKKERKSVRSLTLERTPSQEKMATRGQKGRLGSTSSNSEMEGSGDESKVKRVSRKDSKK